MSFDAAIAELDKLGALESTSKKWRGKGHYSPEYKLYLKSPEWEAKRQQVLQRDNHKCRGCGCQRPLQVHHITYANLGHEPLDDLTTFCDSCHAAIHRAIAKSRRKGGKTVPANRHRKGKKNA